MKLFATMLLGLFWQTAPRVGPEFRHFQFQRAIQIAPATTGPVCAPLDGTVYAHSPSLNDIRLYIDSSEIPYALLTSQTTPTTDRAPVLNLGKHGNHIVFDLEMPSRPYSTVNLTLSGQNFIGTATVTGKRTLDESSGTSLGAFTIFDLNGQRLGRSTSLMLAESSLPYLHVDLAVAALTGQPGFVAEAAMVEGAEVPPSREAQTIYTTVAESTKIARYDQDPQLAMVDGVEKLTQPTHRTVVLFDVPAHVPVERVSFEIEPRDKINFSRAVIIEAKREFPPGQMPGAEIVNGEISRVHMTSSSREIREESLSISAVLGSNARTRMTVKVVVENGDDKPLAIRAVKLQMRERKLCFDAPPQPVTMFYGDDKLVAPVYDYSRIFRPEDTSVAATLDPEQPNPTYVARTDQRSLTERHPELLWVALVAVVLVLGTVAFRSAKRLHPRI